MKKAAFILPVALVLLIVGGCVKGQTVKFEPIPPAKKQPVEVPIPLDQVLAGNGAALVLAGDKKDFLEGDKFLTYVKDAKDRDETERAKARATARATASATASATPASAPTGGTQWTPPPAPAPTPPPAPAAPTMVRYYNTVMGISIELLSNWTKTEGTLGNTQYVLALSPPEGAGDQGAENLMVGVEDTPVELSAQEYLDIVMTNAKAGMTNYAEVEQTDATLDGKPAKKIVYTYTLGGRTIKQALWATTDGLRGYQVLGSALQDSYDKYAPTFEAYAGSFKFE